MVYISFIIIKNIMSSNSSQSVSCVYELLNNDNNSATWSDDGTIVLNRPLASTKLDKIKFRSFSANIRADIQNVTIPTIKTQLCARYIPYVFNDSEPSIYDMSSSVYGLYLANKSGFHLFTDGYPGYDNQTNTPYVIDDCEIAINEDINQAITDGCKYCSKQLEALLGVYANNNEYINNNSYYVNESSPVGYIWNEIQNINNINKPDIIIGFEYLDAEYYIYDYDNPYNNKQLGRRDYYMLLNSGCVSSVSDNAAFDLDTQKLIYDFDGFTYTNEKYIKLSDYIPNYSSNYLIKVNTNKSDGWYTFGCLYNRAFRSGDNYIDFRKRFNATTDNNIANLCFCVSATAPYSTKTYYNNNYVKNMLSTSDFNTMTTYFSNNDAYLVFSRIIQHDNLTYPIRYDYVWSTTNGKFLSLKFLYSPTKPTAPVVYQLIEYDVSTQTTDFEFDLLKEFSWIFLAANNPINKNFIYIPQTKANKYIFMINSSFVESDTDTLYGSPLNNELTPSTGEKIQINPIHYINDLEFTLAFGKNAAVTKYRSNAFYTTLSTYTEYYIINNNYIDNLSYPWYYNPDLNLWCNSDIVTSDVFKYKHYLKAQSKIYFRAPSTTYYPVTDQDKNSYRPIFDFDTISTLIKYNSDNNTLSTIRIPMGTYSKNTFVGELEFYPRFYTEPNALTIDAENTYTTNDYSDASIIYAKYHDYNLSDILYYINEDYYAKFILLVTMRQSDLTLKLICDNYPTLNNIVFYLNETSMVDFKESLTSPMEPNIKCRIVDANGTLITPTAAKKLYSNITVCMDWEFYN